MKSLARFAFVVLASVIASALTTLLAIALLRGRWTAGEGRVLQASRLEIVDQQGRIRGTFGLDSNTTTGYDNRLTLRDSDGRESIVMFVDAKGHGALGFASDRWNEGAVILGHLDLDDESQGLSNAAKDTQSAAWGLSVKGPRFDYTRMGYMNSGQVLSPTTAQPAEH